MKRTKIMLTAIAVCAIVGGALASKAKKFGGQNYCYTTTRNLAATCPLTATLRTFFPQSPTQQYKYTTTNNVTNCTQVPSTRCTSGGGPGGA